MISFKFLGEKRFDILHLICLLAKDLHEIWNLVWHLNMLLAVRFGGALWVKFITSLSAPREECCLLKKYFYFKYKTYVVGTQKHHLNEV